jgi:hypothetical protein
MRTQAVLKPEADLLELMRADRQVQKSARPSRLPSTLKRRGNPSSRSGSSSSPRGDAGPLVDSWVRPVGRSECQVYRDKRPRFSGGRKRPAIAVPSRARATTSRLYGRKRLHRRCRRALAGQGGRGRSAGAHDTADLGVRRVLGGFPMGPRRGDRPQKAPAQSAPHARGRLRTAAREKLPLALVI